MTEKLYEQDSMLKSCLATVLSCAEDKRGYAVVLDRTVFFPEGGGQLSDRGTLGGVKMTYAAQRGSEVVRYCNGICRLGRRSKRCWTGGLVSYAAACRRAYSFACGLEAVRS